MGNKLKKMELVIIIQIRIVYQDYDYSDTSIAHYFDSKFKHGIVFDTNLLKC